MARVEILLEAVDQASGTLGKIGGALGGLGTVAAGAAAAGLAAFGAAAVGMGAAALNAGLQLDSAFDSIVVGTGASGEVLEGLKGTFRDVFGSVPTTAEAASGVIAAFNQRLGLTGDALTEVTKPMLEMTRLLGGDAVQNTELFTRVMGDWSLSNDAAAGTLDKLFAAGQATGIGVDQLMQKVVQFGAPLRNMGFTLDDSIALFGKWEKEGVNAELVMGSLRIAAGQFAEEMGAGLKVIGGGVPNLEEAQQKMLELTVALEKAEKKQAALNEKGSAAEQALNAQKVADYRAQIEELSAAMAKGEFVYDMTAESQNGLRTRLLETFDAIKNATSATEALNIANDVFGKRAGGDMAAAIREGRFEFEDLLAVLESSEGAILSTAEATADFGEKWTVIKNRVTLALEPLGVKLMDTIGIVLDKFMPAFESALPVLTRFMEVVATAIGNLAGGDLRAALEGLGEDLFNIFPPEVAAPINAALEFLSATLQNLITFVVTNLPLMQETFATVWAAVQSVLATVGQLITGTLMPAIATIWEQTGVQLPTAQQTFERVMAAIGAAVTLAAAFITDVLVPGIKVAVDWVVANWPKIQATVQRVISDVQTVITNVMTAVQQFWAANGATIIANTQAAFDTIRNIIQTVLAGVQAFWNEHGATIVAFVQAYFQQVQENISVRLEFIRGVIETVLDGIQVFWDAWGETIKQIWVNFTEGVKALVDAFMALLRGDFASFGENMKTVWTKMWENLRLIVFEAVEQILKVDWIGMGADIIRGIASGITSMNKFLADAALAAARAAFEAAKGFLGISSPSKLFAGIGANMMQGMAQGISANAGLPAMATAQAAASTVSTVNNYWTVNASYPYQSASSVAQELRLRSLLDTR
jgi:phage-related minor tail protein